MKWQSLQPLNFYQVHGTLCCHHMLRSMEKMAFTNHFLCYEAKTIYEANVLLIWGSISLKLAGLLINVIENMANQRSLIHMKGCDLRIHNSLAFSFLDEILPINSIFFECQLSDSDYRAITNEARRCLRA